MLCCHLAPAGSLGSMSHGDVGGQTSVVYYSVGFAQGEVGEAVRQRGRAHQCIGKLWLGTSATPQP
jgi:hypothetical protein